MTETVRVREAFIEYKRAQTVPCQVIGTSVDVAAFLRDKIGYRVTEHFVVIALDSRNRPTAWTIAGIGGAMACAVTVADILRFPILAGSPALIVAHNHPSGDPTPSATDIDLTKRIKDGAKILGLQLLDHVIATDTAHSSFRDRGLLK